MIILILFVLGLCLGSFINALVWRVYKLEQFEEHKPKSKKNKKLNSKYSIIKGRSMCTYCEHQLHFWDLLPVISWLMLKGKCRYCKKIISIQYPIVEFLTALLFAGFYIFWPLGFGDIYLYIYFVTWLTAIVGLVAMAIYDIKWMILPDRIMWPLVAMATGSFVLQIILGRPLVDIPRLLLAVLIASGIFWLLFQISGGRWIGGGDVKLGLLLGIMLVKPELALLQLFVASVLGVIFALPSLLTKKLAFSSKIPFGPFLIAAAIISMLFGQQIINLYLNFIGIN